MRQKIPMFVAAILLASCSAQAEPVTGGSPPAYAPPPTEYDFVSAAPALVKLADAFATPPGFRRVDAAAGSFGAWLRELPLLRNRTSVRSYRGEALRSPSAGIVPLDLGARDLQQCADSILRLHAEFLWARERRDDLVYHFTSGDRVRFADWVAGERIRAEGSRVTRSLGAPRADDHDALREWLDLVFMYAGTRSLSLDSTSVAPDAVLPGDFFVAPGSPGHAVIVLDVATNTEGSRIALLGQGFMPAQEFHVIRADGPRVIGGVWFELPSSTEDELVTPSWKPFYGADARRFVH